MGETEGVSQDSEPVAGTRQRLVAEHRAAQDRLAELEAGRRRLIQAARGDNSDDEHDPEGATGAWEREQAQAMITAARARLAELEHAVDRLGQGRYGVCERCGAPIPAGRLAARPDARTCVACAGLR